MLIANLALLAALIITFFIDIRAYRRLETRIDGLENRLCDEHSLRRQAEVKLGVAEKRIIDLQGQIPGRDNTGRFTKKPKDSAVLGSE